MGEYDTAENKYSASEIYIFNFTKIPGLQTLTVSANDKELALDTNLCDAKNIAKTQTKTTQAVDNSIKINATPLQNETEVYIGDGDENKTTLTIDPNQYPVTYEEEQPYADIPIKLVAKKSGDEQAVEQNYTVKVKLLNPYIQINEQPSDVICYNGDTATLQIKATTSSLASLSYQWYKVGEGSDESLSAANTASYTPVTDTVGTASYYCVVTSTKDGKTYLAKSEAATVTVKDSNNLTPVIVSQPKSTIECNQGDELTLSVKALEPKQGTLSYQWYRNETVIEGEESAKTKDYKPSTEFNNTTSYRCEVTNTVGEQSYTTKSNTVRVITALAKSIHTPTVIGQPGTYVTEKYGDMKEGGYNPVSKGDAIPSPFYVRFQYTDYNVKASLALYHSTENSYENAELVANAKLTEGHQGGVANGGWYKDYKVDPNTAYPTGEHYFFVEITLSPTDESLTIPAASIKTDILKIDFAERITSLEGKGTQENPYLIKTAENLKEIQTLVADGDPFAGAYFEITENITLPADWSPIGSKTSDVINAFSGTIDGENHTITVPENGLPLLGYIKNAHVKNLNIYGTKINGAGLINNYTGVGLDGNAVILENVCLKSGSSTLKSGLVASSDGNGFAHASAGFVVTIRNCVIEEGVTVGYDGNQSQIGSFAGRINGTIESCTSEATVKGANYVGGILGTRDNAMSQCVVKNCSFSGTIEASGAYAGGIVGGGYDNETAPNGASPTIVACTVTGNVKGTERVGGIFGGDGYVAQTWDNVVGSISANRFSGKVSGNKYVGAIIGYRNSLNRYDTIENNYYTKDCGADTAIGYVKYIDTNYKNPTKNEGTIVFNTEKNTSGCPTVEGCAWKAQHNRTDDPLGADKEKLAKAVDTIPTEAICYELVLKSGKVKTDYILGEEFDFDDAKFTAKWTDGNEKEVNTKEITVSGYNKNSHSIQTVTLSYGYGQLTVQVAVKQKQSTDPAKNTLTVKVTVSLDKQDKEILSQLKEAGYTVKYRFYRSTKKSAGYKSTVTKKTTTYTNTSGKKGTKYFYKVQVRVYDENGKLVAKTALKQCKYASRNWSK